MLSKTKLHFYSLEEMEYIKTHYDTMTTKEIAKKLNRNVWSLRHKITKMKLRKETKFWSSTKIQELLERLNQTDFPLRIIANEFHISVSTLRKVMRRNGLKHKYVGCGWHQNGMKVNYVGNQSGRNRGQLLQFYKYTCWDCKKTLLPAGLVIHHDWSQMPVQILILCVPCHKKRHKILSSN
jgi:hypothetical protein